MNEELRREYARIGEERDAAGRDATREKRWFYARVAGVCWIWTVLGLLLVGRSFNINAGVDGIYFPALMEKARMYFSAGMFVGTAGPIGTLLVGWRRAQARGYLD